MTQNTPQQPSRSDRLKPIELVGLSAGMALFIALVILLTTRDFVFAGIAFGIAFIVALVVIAMFALNMKPNAAEKNDLDEQNHGL